MLIVYFTGKIRRFKGTKAECLQKLQQWKLSYHGFRGSIIKQYK